MTATTTAVARRPAIVARARARAGVPGLAVVLALAAGVGGACDDNLHTGTGAGSTDAATGNDGGPGERPAADQRGGSGGAAADGGGSGGSGGAGGAASDFVLGFLAAAVYEYPGVLLGLALGDLDGNDRPEAVLSHPAEGSDTRDKIWIMGNRGDGTFTPAVAHAVGVRPGAIRIGDLDGDGRGDLVVGNSGSGRCVGSGDAGLTTLLTRPDGGFSTTSYVEIGCPGTLTLGDLDGDDRPDLVIIDNPFQPEYVADVRVMLNDGAGRFAAPVSYAAGALPRAVAIGDLDGDGRPDLAVANGGSWNGLGYEGMSVEVLINAGGGAFAPAISHPTAAAPFTMAIGDIDRDGKSDLALVTAPPMYSGAGIPGASVEVWLGRGDGTFAPPVHYADSVGAAALGDLDADGWLDLVLAAAGQLRVLPNRGDGSFGAAVAYGVGTPPGDLAVTDVDGDGRLDLATAQWNRLSVLINRGDGTLAVARAYGATANPAAVAPADLDGDGRPDLVAVGWTTASVLINAGDGGGGGDALRAGVDLDAGGSSVAAGDLDGDGRPDLVIAKPGVATLGDPGGVSVLLNEGGGHFAAAVRYGAGGDPNGVTLGDLDGDGRLDLAVANRAIGGVSVLLNRGDGSFGAPATYAASGRPSAVTAGDLDGDGKTDLVVANYGSANVSVFRGRGNGMFTAAVNYPVNLYPIAVTAGDLDGDGKLDLVVSSYQPGSSGAVSVLLNDGSGGFRVPVAYALGAPQAVAVGDLDGDGRPDLAVANLSLGVSVLVNRGGGAFAAAVHFSAGPTASSVALVDANGDGKLDMAASNSNGQGVSLLLNTSHRREAGQP